MTKIVKPVGPKSDMEYIKYIFSWREFEKEDWEELEVIGHRYYEETNRMVLFKENGGIFEIPKWNQCYSDLGEDWANKIKEVELAQELEKETKDKGES